jgi:dipeptidyl aminopeptidase/acylaminoacyl peptidase
MRLAFTTLYEAVSESDSARLAYMDLLTFECTVVTDAFDRSIDAFEFVPGTNQDELILQAEDIARSRLFSTSLEAGAAIDRITSDGSVAEFFPLSNGDVVFSLSSYTSPANIYRLDVASGDLINLTDSVNGPFLSQYALEAPTELYIPYSYPDGDSGTIQGWFFAPPGHDGVTSVPPIAYLHGGPESPWTDAWSYRWNPALMASQGYALWACNFHGSGSFGLEFKKSIREDWGGKPISDQINTFDAVLDMYPWLDRDRQTAMGASYGGYSISMHQGTTDRFKALVYHDGIYDLANFASSTDELFFPIREQGGLPWESPELKELYDRSSPMTYVSNWKTPELVITGLHDFRISTEAHAIATFNMLQYKGIDSKLIMFPRASHWVLNPADSIHWHDEVLAWLAKYTQ